MWGNELILEITHHFINFALSLKTDLHKNNTSAILAFIATIFSLNVILQIASLRNNIYNKLLFIK